MVSTFSLTGALCSGIPGCMYGLFTDDFSFFAVAAASLALALVFAMAPPSSANTIKVGIVDCYSGPPSTYTNDVRDAFKMEAEKINAGGGILGRQIEVLTRDSKFKVDLGLAAAKELILREEVDILMGTINSSLALAISDLAKKETSNVRSCVAS